LETARIRGRCGEQDELRWDDTGNAGEPVYDTADRFTAGVNPGREQTSVTWLSDPQDVSDEQLKFSSVGDLLKCLYGSQVILVHA
jgi:hypothetical protein